MKRLLPHIKSCFLGLIFFFVSLTLIATISFAQPPCNPPIAFDAGLNASVSCGGSTPIGQVPSNPPPNFTMAPTCKKTAMSQNGPLTQGGGIYNKSVVTTGGTTNINNPSNTFVDVTNTDPMGPNAWQTLWYSDFSAQYVEVCPGGSFQITTTARSLYSNQPYFCQIWVDWNNDGAFNAAEVVHNSGPYNTNNFTVSGTINVPAGQPNGQFRMRIRFKDNAPFVPSDNADGCTFQNPVGIPPGYGGYTGNNYGNYYFSDEVEDYSVKVNCGGSPGAGNYTYNWTPPAGLSSSTIPNPVATPTATTTYTVTVTDVTNNCITTDQITVTVPNTTPIFTNPGPICIGNTYTLPTTSTNGITGSWSPALNTSATTTYAFTPNNGQCASSVNMTVVVNPLPTLNAGNDVSICNGASTNLLATGASTYTWSPTTGLSASNIANPVASPSSTTTYTVSGTNANGCVNTDQVTVTVTPLTTPTFNPIAPICIGGTFTLPTTSTNGITGAWSPAVNTSATTTYTFTPDPGQCATTTTMSVTINPLPTVNAGNDVSMCAGNSTNLTASGASTYTWDNGLGAGASHSVSPASTTTYTVTGTDANGCVNTDQVVISMSPNVTPTFTNPGPICIGGTYTLPTTSNNGITGVWSPAINTTATTTYTFTPNPGQCGTNVNMTFVVNPLPTVNAGNNVALCTGNSTTLTATGANAYTWDNGLGAGASHTVTPASTTTYTVTGTDANNCMNTSSVTVTMGATITPTFTNPGPICIGGTYSLPTTSNNGITGVWSPALNTSATTTYTFTPNSGQCGVNTTMTVVVNPLPTVNALSNTTICIGNSANISANGASTYSWDNGLGAGASHSVSPASTTTYTVTGTDANGCLNTAQVTVTITPLTTPTFNQVAPICTGGSFVLPTTSLNNYNGSWSPSINNTATTTYTFTPNAGQCASTATMSVTVNPLPTVNAGNDVTICIGSSTALAASGASTYSWDNGLGAGANQNVSPASNTTYTVTGTDGNGCINTDQVAVAINQLTTPTFNAVAAICTGDNLTLPSTSLNGYTGTWSPAINNTATTTYTFTPNAGQCAGTTTMTVNVNAQTPPTIGSNPPSCTSSETSNISNYSSTLSYSFTPSGPTVGSGGEINGMVIGTSYTVSATGTCTSNASGSFSNDPQLITATMPIVSSVPANCSADEISSISNYDPNLTYVFTPSGPSVGSNGAISNMLVGISYIVYATNGVCPSTTTNPFGNDPMLQTPTAVATGTTICSGETANIQITSSLAGTTFSWTALENGVNGAANGSGSVINQTLASENGGSVIYTITPTNGACVGTPISVSVNVSGNVLALFSPSSTDLTDIESTVHFDNNSIGATNYHWTFGDGAASDEENPSYTYQYDGTNAYTVTLTATNAYGCTDVATATIGIHQDIIFWVPNTFTPDADQYNNEFKPVFSVDHQSFKYELLIFNRWGELIFESHDIHVGWDGTYLMNKNGLVQDDVYTWKIKVSNMDDDGKITRVGHVTLLR